MNNLSFLQRLFLAPYKAAITAEIGEIHEAWRGMRDDICQLTEKLETVRRDMKNYALHVDLTTHGADLIAVESDCEQLKKDYEILGSLLMLHIEPELKKIWRQNDKEIGKKRR